MDERHEISKAFDEYVQDLAENGGLTDCDYESFEAGWQAALAQEGGQAVPHDWVDCPVCGEPDMQRTFHERGTSLIHCCNHGCRSNGGACDTNPGASLPDGWSVERTKSGGLLVKSPEGYMEALKELSVANVFANLIAKVFDSNKLQPAPSVPDPDLQLIEERDYWEEKATELAEGVGKYLGVEVGEHSSANCPVQNAIDAVFRASEQSAQKGSVPEVCDGKEQEAFEVYASGKGYDMSQHPLHYLFTNDKTNVARQAWKAAISYCHEAATPQPAESELMIMSGLKDAEEEIDRLRSELAAAKAESVQAVANKVCGRLPCGWVINLGMENGAAWVEAINPDTDKPELPDSADKSLIEQINDALQEAIYQEGK